MDRVVNKEGYLDRVPVHKVDLGRIQGQEGLDRAVVVDSVRFHRIKELVCLDRSLEDSEEEGSLVNRISSSHHHNNSNSNRRIKVLSLEEDFWVNNNNLNSLRLDNRRLLEGQL